MPWDICGMFGLQLPVVYSNSYSPPFFLLSSSFFSPFSPLLLNHYPYSLSSFTDHPLYWRKRSLWWFYQTPPPPPASHKDPFPWILPLVMSSLVAVQVEEGEARMVVSVCSCSMAGAEGCSLYKRMVVENPGQGVFYSSYRTMGYWIWGSFPSESCVLTHIYVYLLTQCVHIHISRAHKNGRLE